MASVIESYHHGDLRAALLDEAAAIIASEGTAGVTMRALGERLGVSRSAAYRHFADKNALLVAVAQAGFARLAERVEAVETGALRPSLDRFRRLGEAYVRFALENPAHYRLMYGREALVREEVPELQQAAVALFERLAALIREHQRAGLIKRQDPQMQAYAAWSAIHGLASLLIEGQIMATDDIDGLIRHTTQTVLEGMRKR